MKLKEKLSSKIKNPKIRAAVENTALRARIVFVLSIIITFAFAVFNAVTGIVYQSLWYGSLAIYYIMLALQKILLVLLGRRISKRYTEENGAARKKLNLYLMNGVFLLVLDLSLTAATIQMATNKNPVKTDMIIAIATAAFAFIKISAAIVNLIKSRKLNDVVLQVMRNISFVAATVSMLALTSTMVDTFGDFEELLPLIKAVSVGVSLVIIGVGIFMIVNACIKLSKMKNDCAG